ncbi:MAG: [protein-PII] uridylyltransferase [Bacteroidota bacterium]
MHEQAQWLKSYLSGRQQEIAAAHSSGASGLATCVSLTQRMDELIRNACASLPPDISSRADNYIAILALGGYGRAELCPKSDVDIMILYDVASGKGAAEEYAKALLHLLWDAGIDLGHSVRTVDEAAALHGQTLDAWVSMLEGRVVHGNAKLAELLFTALRGHVTPDRWMIEGILADAAARHERYGNSVKLLEPNVKKSAGGLRDVHSLFWLYRTRAPHLIGTGQATTPATRAFLDLLQKDGLLDHEGIRSVNAAFEFLLRTRHEMHYLRQSMQDTLEFTLQREVAEGLGFGPKAETHSVEVFMREYYLHARTLFRLHMHISQKFKVMIEPSLPADKGTPVGSLFIAHRDLLALASSAPPFSRAEQLFEAFVYCAENDLSLDASLSAAIEHSLDLVTGESVRSKELSMSFGRILRSKNVAKTLHEMNDLGILGKYIPEFGDLVAFFQHNVYHYFTADEHTLLAVANAEKLREQQGVLREVFRSLQRRDILHLAILLHDIAKPRGVADHEITGVTMAEEILDRMGMHDAIPDVTFLVRNHLLMEQIAFRRNIHDPETIKEFAARFERPEQLDYLYLLTYADLSAVNTNVWTEWKALLLQELYQRASEVLRRNLHGPAIDAFHHSKHRMTAEGIVERLGSRLPREEVQRHLEQIRNESYLALFSEQEIEEHIRKSQSTEAVSTIFVQQDGFTEVTTIARDAPFALAKFCAVLAANDANIFDANIFTRDDGIIIDRFRVSDVSTGQQLEQRVCGKIAADLDKVIDGRIDIAHLFEAHKKKWKRRPQRASNSNVRQDVEFEDNPGHTIIDVYAQDSLGLLYRVTEAMSRLGLDIYFAKIATRMDGVIDAFYTLDRSGRKITDPDRQATIRIEILRAVRMTWEEKAG